MSAVVVRGDAAHLPLPDESVDLIITSVPYWGLRSYTDNGEHYGGQIGSEETPEEWLEALWTCTREWVRVLKPSGSIFVNCGDKYDSGTTTGRVNPGTVKDGRGQGWNQGTPRVSTGRAKSLLLLPHRYAIGCADRLGLILRAEVIWDKANPIPESATDRTRREHELIWHLTKQPVYFSAIDEVREAATTAAADKRSHPENYVAVIGRSMHDHEADRVRGMRADIKAYNPLGKPPGSIWKIPSQQLAVPPHLGIEHFAAFPTELPRRIILGWSPAGICRECGEGRRPVADKAREVFCGTGRHRPGAEQVKNGAAVKGYAQPDKWRTKAMITGYACACPQPTAPTRPAVVLDPFAGTGTSLLVADVLGRTGIGVELSSDYCRLARWRINDPGERARALGVPKPPPVPEGQQSLFDLEAS